ncbi:MAG TPA: 2-C-methyl-D-erythritol 2,4-cyclodiphosphate synthase [Chthonomonadaceae bacterium]|nr:2-C-methyl-D-erythritol 2,4-cyclodiphosphate synthase [Chthonomonadaceae bacterium]
MFAPLAGRAVLEWTLSAFDAHPAISCVALVVGEGEQERAAALAAAFPKVTAIVTGGETRAASVRNGLEALPAGIEIALVHDAARPIVTADLIARVIAATAQTGAAVPGLPLSDTVKRVDGSGLVRATVPRTETLGGETLTGMTAVQTPQGARAALLRAAYAHLFPPSPLVEGEGVSGRNEDPSSPSPLEGEGVGGVRGMAPTDEASLIESLGLPVAVVPGDPANIKITRPEDLAFAETLLAARQSHPMSKAPTAREEVRTGFGYDVHAFAPPEAGRRLFLGGVEIAHDQGLEGHSDADALLHAVCDALLGAVSLGDIGLLFPNTDPDYKDIASLRLLAIVRERVQESGWEIVNIDATVVAEAPKLMPHRPAMQQAMAACLGLDPERISVKATTSEKMGFVGRREGIACWAVATVRSHPFS